MQPILTDFIKEIAETFGFTYADMISERRVRDITEVRHMASALLRARGLSYPKIGELLGGRDHSTIINGIERMKKMKEIVDTYYEFMDEIMPRPD